MEECRAAVINQKQDKRSSKVLEPECYNLWLKYLHEGLLPVIAKLFCKSFREEYHTVNGALTETLDCSLILSLRIAKCKTVT